MPAVIPFVTFALAAMTGTDPAPSESAAYPIDEGGAHIRVMSDAAITGQTLTVTEGGRMTDTPSRAASASGLPHGTILEGGRT